MTDWQINGLPLHPLLVHFVVVLLPLAALMLILGSVWPAARRRLGVIIPIIALVALLGVPLATQAGEALERQVDPSAALERHAELGDHLLPWAAGLFVLCVAHWLWFRTRGKNSADTKGTSARSVPSLILATVAILVAAGATANVVQIGDTGAQAVWSTSSDGSTPAPASGK